MLRFAPRRGPALCGRRSCASAASHSGGRRPRSVTATALNDSDGERTSASASADDLRQALRDRRRVAGMYEEESSFHLDHLRIAQKIEARLRARITADLAAMKLAQAE